MNTSPPEKFQTKTISVFVGPAHLEKFVGLAHTMENAMALAKTEMDQRGVRSGYIVETVSDITRTPVQA